MSDGVPGGPPGAGTSLTIVSDLDGTLLDSRGEVSGRTRAAVRAVREAGHTFVIATGRPVRDVRAIARQLGHTGITVCGNGSLTYDHAREEILDYRPLGFEAARAVLTVLGEALPGARFGAERWLELILEKEFRLDPALCADARRVGLLAGELDERGFGKIIVQVDGGAGDRYRGLAALLPDGCESTVSTLDFCEVTRAGVDKARALERLGMVPEDVVVFGDMLNDLPMFAWAGRSVAVANSHPEVIRAAAEMTFSNDEDGVARWLENLLR